jgi:integrase
MEETMETAPTATAPDVASDGTPVIEGMPDYTAKAAAPAPRPRHTQSAQSGSLFVTGVNADKCYLKFYVQETRDGVPHRAHKTVFLCEKSDTHYWTPRRATKNNSRKWTFSRPVLDFQEATMKAAMGKLQPAAVQAGDMRVVDFWDRVYLPYLEAIVPLTGVQRRAPSTVKGFKQIWRQHLKAHFSTTTLKDYEPAMGKRLLRSLLDTQGKTTLKHIKSLASSIFSHALDEEYIKVNPWHDVRIPEDAIESEATEHYTLPETEDMISALVDHVDAQLVLALACFLGLRPGEIAALKWEDFDSKEGTVHIQRSVVHGIVGPTKTQESNAILPLLEQVVTPLVLWHTQCGKPSEGYVFNSRENTPVDLHNLTARVIRPHVEGKKRCVICECVPKDSGVRWKTLYSGRRGAATAIVEATGGNLAIAQALLRHKSQITTATFYKKAVSPQSLLAGVRRLELAAKNGHYDN